MKISFIYIILLIIFYHLSLVCASGKENQIDEFKNALVKFSNESIDLKISKKSKYFKYKIGEPLYLEIVAKEDILPYFKKGDWTFVILEGTANSLFIQTNNPDIIYLLDSLNSYFNGDYELVANTNLSYIELSHEKNLLIEIPPEKELNDSSTNQLLDIRNILIRGIIYFGHDEAGGKYTLIGIGDDNQNYDINIIYVGEDLSNTIFQGLDRIEKINGKGTKVAVYLSIGKNADGSIEIDRKKQIEIFEL